MRFPFGVVVCSFVLVTSIGWCAEPFSLFGSRGVASSAVSYAPCQDATMPLLGGNLGFSVSLFSATLRGDNGASPGTDLGDSGAGGPVGGAGAQALYQTSALGMPAKIQGGYASVNAGGGDNIFSGGTTSGGPNPGDRVNTNLRLNLWNAQGDLGVVNMGGGDGSYLSLAAGPRLQWVLYNDSFTFNNGTQGTSTSRARSLNMFGIGAYASLGLPAFALTTGYGTVAPRINLAATFGTGNGMRYTWYEGFLQFFRATPGQMGSLTGEVGWIWMDFRENTDRISTGAITPSNAAYSISAPIVKAALSF